MRAVILPLQAQRWETSTIWNSSRSVSPVVCVPRRKTPSGVACSGRAIFLIWRLAPEEEWERQ